MKVRAESLEEGLYALDPFFVIPSFYHPFRVRSSESHHDSETGIRPSSFRRRS